MKKRNCNLFLWPTRHYTFLLSDVFFTHWIFLLLVYTMLSIIPVIHRNRVYRQILFVYLILTVIAVSDIPVHGCNIQTPLFLASFLPPCPMSHSFATSSTRHSPKWLAPPLTSPSQALFSTSFSRQARKSSTNLALALLTLPALHCTLATNLQVANLNALLHLLVASSIAFLELIGRMFTFSISSRLELRPATSSYCDKFWFAVLIHFLSFPLHRVYQKQGLCISAVLVRENVWFFFVIFFIFYSVIVYVPWLQVYINKVCVTRITTHLQRFSLSACNHCHLFGQKFSCHVSFTHQWHALALFGRTHLWHKS